MTQLTPLSRRDDVLDFLLNRRSRPAKTLTTPVPDQSDLEVILTAAARSPDHGKLEPWRFLVMGREACSRLGALSHTIGQTRDIAPEKIAKSAMAFEEAHLVVAVIASPTPSEKVPETEQVLSAGAVCLAMVNGALASGWGANWLTGWQAMDRAFLDQGLELAPHEFVAGFIHLGTETRTPPDRPRPDIAKLTTWVDE